MPSGLGNIIVLLVLGTVVGLAVYRLWKSHHDGTGSCGCGCSNCKGCH